MENKIKLPPIIAGMASYMGYKAGVTRAAKAFAPPKTETSPLILGKGESNLLSGFKISSDIYEHPKNIDALLRVENLLAGLSADDRRKKLKELRSRYAVEEKALKDSRKKLENELEVLKHVKAAYLEISDDVLTKPLAIEKPNGSLFSELRQAARDHQTIHSVKPFCKKHPEQDRDWEKELFCQAETFVIEHDWAAAFANSPDMAAAPFKLPFDVCAFEFSMNKHAVIGFAIEADETINLSVVAKTSFGWLVPAIVCTPVGKEWPTEAEWQSLMNLIGSQIRAVCIALDAEVATADVVRAPHTGTNAGKNIYTPLKSYHVVSLSRKPRAAELPSDGEPMQGRRLRLHFRRGHWRHFPTFKTWVKWCLVGDPDLGFIDKHYKL